MCACLVFSPKVLLVDASPNETDGFVATVLIRTREARGEAPLDGSSEESSGSSAEGAAAAGDGAAAAGDGASDGAAEGAEAVEAAEDAPRETTQLWTFVAPHPPVASYVRAR